MGPATPRAFDSSSCFRFRLVLGCWFDVVGMCFGILLRNQINELELSPFRSLPLFASLFASFLSCSSLSWVEGGYRHNDFLGRR